VRVWARHRVHVGELATLPTVMQFLTVTYETWCARVQQGVARDGLHFVYPTLKVDFGGLKNGGGEFRLNAEVVP
jgi:hypothetical protein